MKVGECRAVQLNLEFPESPVTFKLIEGNGPVYIHCQHVPRAYGEEIEEIAEEELLSEEEAVSANFMFHCMIIMTENGPENLSHLENVPRNK